MDYRRYYILDSIVFITQVVANREPIFHNSAHIDLLRTILHNVRELHPFQMLGYVILPDHLHLLMRPGDGVTHSQIMHSLKLNFTKAYKIASCSTETLHLWQRRYWDHIIRNELDLQHHLDYIHL